MPAHRRTTAAALAAASFKDVHQSDRNPTTAATPLITTPVSVVFFFAHKAFIEGATLTGAKG